MFTLATIPTEGKKFTEALHRELQSQFRAASIDAQVTINSTWTRIFVEIDLTSADVSQVLKILAANY